MGKDEEWTTGQRVYVPRITRDESVSLTIYKFGGDEDDPNPQVQLLYTEFNRKMEAVRQMFRFAMLDELEDLPVGKATKGGATARIQRNLVPVLCGCGCGIHTSGTEFRQGHDAKLKSRLRKISTGVFSDPDLTDEQAHAELVRRGWA